MRWRVTRKCAPVDQAQLVGQLASSFRPDAGVAVAELSAQWGFTPACFYQWLVAFLLRGVDSLVYSHGGGRRAKLTPTQKKRLEALTASDADEEQILYNMVLLAEKLMELISKLFQSSGA